MQCCQLDQLTEYMFRMFSFSQLNLSYAFTQHLLLLTQPIQYYKNIRTHKQIKNIYYRDDPSFNCIQLVILFVACVIWCGIFGLTRATFTWYQFIRNTFGVVLIEYIVLAFIISYGMKLLADRYIRDTNNNISTDVSYAYALDIHFNAMTFIITLLVIIQFLLLPILYISPDEYNQLSITQSLVYTGTSNLLYCVAFVYYIYISWLGYALLTTNTQFKRVLYYCVSTVATLCTVSTLFNFNIMLFILSKYYDLSSSNIHHVDTASTTITSADTQT